MPTGWRISCAGSASGRRRVVGLCVERSPEMVIGLLGILKAGGAYLPLDPGYPAERLSFMLGDAGACVLVTQQALVSRLPSRRCRSARAARRRLGRAVAPAGAAAGARPRPRPPGLRDLHLRLNRNTQRRRRHPWGSAQLHRRGLQQDYTTGRWIGMRPLLTPLAFDATVTSLFLPLLSRQARACFCRRSQAARASWQAVNAGVDDFSLLQAHSRARRCSAISSAPDRALQRAWRRCLVIGGEMLGEPTVAPWLRSVARGSSSSMNMARPRRWSAARSMRLHRRDLDRQRCRLVVRSGTRGFMSWTLGLRLFLRGLLGSFTSRVLGLRGAIGVVLG